MNKHLHNKIHHQYSSEAGFTLVEMLVAMTIASIFFVSFTAVVVGTIQTMKTGDQRTVAQQNTRIAVNFLSDEIKQMAELEAPSYREYRDYRTGGFPPNGECEDQFFNDVYPYYRQSTDGSMRGYIDLHHRDASAGVDEYEDFRNDGMPYDVRPLFPNKINFKMNQSSYFPHTRYSNMKPPAGNVIDLDGQSMYMANGFDNSQSAEIRVTFEHQKQPPRWGLINDEGLLKNLYLPVLGGDGGGVNVMKKPFVLLRSFEIENISAEDSNDWQMNGTISLPYNLVDADGNDSGIDLTRPTDDLRQIVADHIANVRFRYFHIRGGEWIEIRYDPFTEHMSHGHSMPDNVNDGYYRYYTKYGDEIYSWASPDGDLNLPPADSTTAEIIEHWDGEGDPNEFKFMPTNEFERGLLLFEGWRYVNTIMVTVKGVNAELQTTYSTSTAFDVGDINRPDFGLGFVDFQKGGSSTDDLNTIDPMWHALDSYREGLVKPGNDVFQPGDNDGGPFDFVDPNGNPAFDPGRFVTLQTLVSPPMLYSTSREAAGFLRMGLSFI